MRRSRRTETNIILFLLAATPVLIALLCSGCTSPMQKIREDPRNIYHGYDGPKLPKENIAMVWWQHSIVVVAIDGKALNDTPYMVSENSFFGAELLPGRHTMEVYTGATGSTSVIVNIEADLSAGQVYRMSRDVRLYAKEPVDYAVSLIDEETGALVAGRPPEVLKWSWYDWKQALERMKSDYVTEKQTIAFLSEPVRHMCDNIAVYLVSRGEGLIAGWPIFVLPPKHGGFLFVEFDASNSLRGYTFVDVPFRECFRSPFTVWDTESWHSEYKACWSRLEENACDEFRAVTGRSVE